MPDYYLSSIPEPLYRLFKARAALDGLSVRAGLLKAMAAYAEGVQRDVDNRLGAREEDSHDDTSHR